MDDTITNRNRGLTERKKVHVLPPITLEARLPKTSTAHAKPAAAPQPTSQAQPVLNHRSTGTQGSAAPTAVVRGAAPAQRATSARTKGPNPPHKPVQTPRSESWVDKNDPTGHIASFFYDTNKTAIDKSVEGDFDDLVKALSPVPEKQTITITGYADRRGSSSANDRLGMLRAQALAKRLAARLPKAKIVVQSGGEREGPQIGNTAAALARFRRVDVKVNPPLWKYGDVEPYEKPSRADRARSLNRAEDEKLSADAVRGNRLATLPQAPRIVIETTPDRLHADVSRSANRYRAGLFDRLTELRSIIERLSASQETQRERDALETGYENVRAALLSPGPGSVRVVVRASKRLVFVTKVTSWDTLHDDVERDYEAEQALAAKSVDTSGLRIVGPHVKDSSIAEMAPFVDKVLGRNRYAQNKLEETSTKIWAIPLGKHISFEPPFKAYAHGVDHPNETTQEIEHIEDPEGIALDNDAAVKERSVRHNFETSYERGATVAHEVAHLLQDRGITERVQLKIKNLFHERQTANVWIDKYSSTNEHEYFARSVEEFLGLGSRSRRWLEENDTGMFDLLSDLLEHDIDEKGNVVRGTNNRAVPSR